MNILDMAIYTHFPKLATATISNPVMLASVGNEKAVKGTTSVINKVGSALQIIGYAGGVVAIIACALVMMLVGQSKRESIKGHLAIIMGCIVLIFAAGALGSFLKGYSKSSF